jgi:hypothetical protein
MSIQYIADGYNKNLERVVLWRTGEYQYELEVAGKTELIHVEYNDAMVAFNKELGV